jgi:hypothetical protein
MFLRLYTYFGVIGIVSIMLWLAVLVVLVNYCRHQHRFIFFTRAAVLAACACLVAAINSYFVSRIEVDTSHELKLEFEQRQKELNYLKERAARVKFIEDGRYDSMDLAGIAGKESLSIYENAARGTEHSYLYKQDTVQKKPAPAEGAKLDLETAIASSERTGPEKRGARQLPLIDVITANRWDKINRSAAALVFLIALLATIWDYLSRFNKPFGIRLPLPVSSRFVDHFFQKAHAALFSSVSPALVHDYLRAIVQKGETFIYFGANGPFNEQMSLARLSLPLHHLWKEFFRLMRPCPLPRDHPLEKPVNTFPVSPRKFPRLISLLIAVRLKSAGSIRLIFFMLISAIKKNLLFIRKLLGPVLKPWQAGVRFLNGLCSSFLLQHRGLKSFIENIKCGIIELFPVQILTYSPGQPPFSDMFVCESAWFGRYCFVLNDAETGYSLLESIRRFLEVRAIPHAMARQTVNIVWNSGTLIPERIAKDIASLSRETNFKFVLVADQALPLEYQNIFAEVFPDFSPAGLKISLFARFLNKCRPLAIRIRLYILKIRDKLQKQRIARAEMKKAKASAVPAKVDSSPAVVETIVQEKQIVQPLPEKEKRHLVIKPAGPTVTKPTLPEIVMKEQPALPVPEAHVSKPAVKVPKKVPIAMPRTGPSAGLKPKVMPAKQAIEQKPEDESKIKIADVDQDARVFKFFCPACGQKLAAEFGWHSKSTNCPRCKTEIVIPKVF